MWRRPSVSFFSSLHCLPGIVATSQDGNQQRSRSPRQRATRRWSYCLRDTRLSISGRSHSEGAAVCVSRASLNNTPRTTKYLSATKNALMGGKKRKEGEEGTRYINQMIPEVISVSTRACMPTHTHTVYG